MCPLKFTLFLSKVLLPCECNLHDNEIYEHGAKGTECPPRMENNVVNFVGLNKVVSGIKWMNGMVKRRLSGGWTEI